MRSCIVFAFAAVLLPAQSTTPAGSISGIFVAPGGQPLYGYLLLTGPALGAASKKVFSSDGSFQFTGLPAGVYSICTRTTYAQAPSTEEPFLDSCAWPFFAQTVRLKAGQALTGIKVKAQPGVRLHLRVNAALPALLTPLANPNALDPNLELHVRGADQLAHIMPAVSSDAGGRDHMLVIPHDNYLILRAKSNTLSISDLTGKLVPNEQQIFAKSGTLPAKITLQVASLP